ncbi:MAG TPA: hypothetical protein VFN67_27770 [Polyangiales bacterium]|nr:hypothetical protein [Polyangiales bacterium]
MNQRQPLRGLAFSFAHYHVDLGLSLDVDLVAVVNIAATAI